MDILLVSSEMLERLRCEKASAQACINLLPLELCEEVAYYYVFIICRYTLFESNRIDLEIHVL